MTALPSDETLRWLADNDPEMLGQVEALLKAALLDPEERRQRCAVLREEFSQRRQRAEPVKQMFRIHRVRLWRWRLAWHIHRA